MAIRIRSLRPVILGFAMGMAGSILAAEQLPEEITVTNITLKNLRADLAQAQDAMNAIFNDHVDKEFRIQCEDVAITGSLIKYRLCEPNYRRDAKIKDIRDAQDGGVERLRTIRSSETLDRDLAGKNAEFNALMTELAETNQAFLDAAVRVLQLQNAIADLEESP